MSAQKSHRTLDLHHLDAECVEVLIGYANGEDLTISREKLPNFLRASEFLCVQTVSKICSDLLWDSVDVYTCLSVFSLVLPLNTWLIKEIRTFILANFTYVSLTDDFLQLDPVVLLDMLEDDDLTMCETYDFDKSTAPLSSFFVEPSRQEELILEAILRYVESNPSERAGLLPKFLARGVRLQLIDQAVLLRYTNRPLLFQSVECQNIFSKVIGTGLVSSTVEVMPRNLSGKSQLLNLNSTSVLCFIFFIFYYFYVLCFQVVC